MRHELEELAAKHPGRLHLSFSLTQPPDGWTGHVGMKYICVYAYAFVCVCVWVGGYVYTGEL